MKVNFYIFLFILQALIGYSQTRVSGNISDKSGNPLIGANILITGTYDGGISDTNGNFEFSSEETGVQTLEVSYLGFQSTKLETDMSKMQNLKITLKESTQTMDAVEISASTFKAGDNSKVAVLNPLDIVTTAGSMGDVVAALQTLPGTQSNAEDGRLFVRGGEARETAIFIDGMKVFSPYTRSIEGTPSRGRYSPFLFKGVSFSTGGYGVPFGQALSGILDLQTIDEPRATETNISLMTVGLGIGHTLKGKKQSISLSASYIDLTPYFKLAPSRFNWITPYRGFAGETVYRYKTSETGLFKSYLAGDWGNIELNDTNLNTGIEEAIAVKNGNIYSNNVYRNIINDQTSFFVGLSIGINSDLIEVDDIAIRANLMGSHIKSQFKTILRDDFIVNYGIESMYQRDKFESLLFSLSSFIRNPVERFNSAIFLDGDYFFSKNTAFKPGLRIEHNTLFQTVDVLPRITLAQKVSKNGQISAAAGLFSQEVDSEFLYTSQGLVSEKAKQFLLNYNIKTKKHILRAEVFLKDYTDLVSFQEFQPNVPSNISNTGQGQAYGLDLFWRGNQLIKNIDFWVSYSFLENKRKYQNYPVEATPNFSSRHNLSLVSKTWFASLKSQLGVTYQYGSGRPFENPNTDGFLNERSKAYQNLSLSWAYLISQQKILFLSASNVTGFRNEFGYRYADLTNSDGIYPGQVIRPSEDRFFFAGFFITISADKQQNQLDNL